jgi:hypothetical protein
MMNHHREAGQVIILFLLMMTVTFVIGAIVVDLGLWLSERRGAQTAADFAALAGAQELVSGTDAANRASAFDMATSLAIANAVDAAAIDGAPTSNCSSGNSCINVGTSDCHEDGTDSMPWVEVKVRRPGKALFTSLFGLVDVDIGAVARSCVGSLVTANSLSPFGVQTNFVPANGPAEAGAECDNDTDDDGDGDVNDGCPLSGCLEPDPNDATRTRPVYGAVCILKTGGGGGVSGQQGQLTLGNAACDQTSTNTLRHDFHYGAGANCTIGQLVNTGTGTINGLLQGLEDRLSEEGRCDQLFGTGNSGYDDFDEVFSIAGGSGPVVPSSEDVFSLNDCYVTSGQGGVAPDPEGHVHTYVPRAVDLVLIDELDQGSQTATITGFAAFYVIGCFRDDTSLATAAQIEQDLTNFGSYLNRCEHPTGQDDVLGIFVKSLKPADVMGDPDPNAPTAIFLVK